MLQLTTSVSIPIIMQSFEYTATPARVVFGHGTRSSIAAEMDRLGVGRALIVTTPQQVSLGEEARKTLGGKAVGLYTKAAMHTPSDVTVDAMKYLEETGADCIVAAGGGSTIGLGKALAYRTDLPVIAIPTTYAGSEVRRSFIQFSYKANFPSCFRLHLSWAKPKTARSGHSLIRKSCQRRSSMMSTWS